MQLIGIKFLKNLFEALQFDRANVLDSLMATSNSFLMDSLSDSLLAAVSDTSFFGQNQLPVSGIDRQFDRKIHARLV